jgi:hypothetical protein
MNPGLHSERLAPNCLSYGKAYKPMGEWLMI